MTGETGDAGARDFERKLRDEAASVWLTNLEIDFRTSREERAARHEQLRRKDSVIFRFRMLAAGMALMCVPAVFVLVVLGLTRLGALSVLLGALSGAATRLLQGVSGELREQELDLERKNHLDKTAVRLMSLILVIDDLEERSQLTRRVIEIQMEILGDNSGGRRPGRLSKRSSARALPRHDARSRRPGVAGADGGSSAPE